MFLIGHTSWTVIIIPAFDILFRRWLFYRHFADETEKSRNVFVRVTCFFQDSLSVPWTYSSSFWSSLRSTNFLFLISCDAFCPPVCFVSSFFFFFFFLEMSYMCVQVHAGYHVLKLNRSLEDVISIKIGLSLLSGGQVGWEERRFQITCLRGGIHMLTSSRLCWPASFRYFLTHSLGLSASLLKTRDVYEGSSFFCGP